MKRFAVIGLGKFGAYAAMALYEDGHEVLAIDTDKGRVQAVDHHTSEAILLDATNKDLLKSLGLESMDAVIVSTGTQIGTSILICLYLQEIGVKKIMAKAMDEDHEKILLRVGATEIIHPERAMALHVARELSHSNIIDFIPLTKDFELMRAVAPKAFINKSLKELNLRARKNVHVIAIKEGASEQFILVPHAEYIIRTNDVLTMLGRSSDIRKIKELE